MDELLNGRVQSRLDSGWCLCVACVASIVPFKAGFRTCRRLLARASGVESADVAGCREVEQVLYQL